MDNILVATDLSPRADRAVQRAFRIAKETGATVHVAYVIDHGLPEKLVSGLRTETEALINRFCADIAKSDGPAFRVHVAQGDPSSDIHDLARALEAELIVLGSHRPHPIRDLFRETTLERLVRSSSRAVLVACDRADHPYAKVLVPMDFSPSATRAAHLARTLFPQAEQHGFHAVHVPFHGLTDTAGHSTDAQFYIREAEKERDEWARTSGMADLAKATKVSEGGLHTVLDREIAKFKPDLLALGAHGRSGRAPFLLGSFANDMMRDPPCDLLIARP